ncbi:hypothetical protein HMPREF1579_00004 [Gardnerella vaginalis JCP8066]|nr:hypothetical protein HMPREF1579_00004 [Gardnerella vaginalis JCP8066]
MCFYGGEDVSAANLRERQPAFALRFKRSGRSSRPRMYVI